MTPLVAVDGDGLASPGDTFARICEELDARNSVYDFGVIPIHILGSIYERFLGSVVFKRVFAGILYVLAAYMLYKGLSA